MAEFEVLNISRVKNEDFVGSVCAADDGECRAQATALLGNADTIDYNGYLDIIEAFRYLISKGLKIEQLPDGTEKRLLSEIRKKFFRDIPFYYTEGVSKRILFPVTIEECEDGDTCEREISVKDDKGYRTFYKFRFAGIDTLESIKGWNYCESDSTVLAAEAGRRKCVDSGGSTGEYVTFNNRRRCETNADELEGIEKRRQCNDGRGEWTYRKNPKLFNFEEHILDMWKSELKINDRWPIRPMDREGKPLTAEAREKISGHYEWVTKRMVQDRILYLGNLGSVATKDLQKWTKGRGKEISAEITYNRRSGNETYCNLMEVADKYNRFVARLIVTNEGSEDLLGEFIENELSKAMGTGTEYKKKVVRYGQEKEIDVASPGGADYYEYFTKGTGLVKKVRGYKTVTPMALDYKGQKLLESFAGKDNPMHKVWMTLSPDTLPNPAEIYSPKRCKAMANEWRRFVKKHPEYKCDVQAMLVLIGVAHVYPKYRNEHTDVYLEAERIAKKNGFGPWQERIVNGEKISGDPMMTLLQPDPNDPATLSSKFKKDKSYTGQDSGGNPIELAPEDCCKSKRCQ